MTCSACGNTLTPDVRFCPRCGAPVVAAPPYVPAQPPVYGVPYLPYNRVARHLQTLSILWLVYAAWRFLTGLAGVIFLHGFFGNRFGHDNWNFGWSPFHHFAMENLWPVALASLMVSVACVLLTGFALYTRQPWARILAIVFGILALFHPLLGTALGIYTLWVLAPGASGVEYDALTAQPGRS